MADMVTNGVIFDPFALHSVGLQRIIPKHKMAQMPKVIDTLYKGQHNEAKFKRAFINACHYADSMTVMGPVASPTWYGLDRAGHVEQALRWPVDLNHMDNKFFDQLINALKDEGAALENIYDSVEDVGYLSPVSDLIRVLPHATDHSDATMLQQLDLRAWKLFPHMHTSNGKGAPMLGFLAVIFTFKKPFGNHPIFELTNLAHFPPMVFLIPALMPAGASSMETTPSLCQQPTISSYTLVLNSWGSEPITTYGGPFDFATVDKHGKSPDVLRSLSDVFSALWSQATLYSSWNFDVVASNNMVVGKMFLEPMGAGRRIRGHNRFKGLYEFQGSQHLDEVPNGASAVNSGSLVPMYHAVRGQFAAARKAQRRIITGGDSSIIFVLPSYFAGGTPQGLVKDFFPLTATLFGLLAKGFGKSADLSCLLNHRALGMPTAANPKFMMEQLINRTMGEDNHPLQARPINRVPASVRFKESGDPNIFQLRARPAVLDSYERALYAESTKASDQDYDTILKETECSENFNFMDSFCSSSPKELGSTFAPVKADSKRSKKKELVEASEVIDLFGDVEEMF